MAQIVGSASDLDVVFSNIDHELVHKKLPTQTERLGAIGFWAPAPHDHLRVVNEGLEPPSLEALATPGDAVNLTSAEASVILDAKTREKDE